MSWQPYTTSWSVSQSNTWETPFCNDYYLQRNIPCYHPSMELLPASKDKISPLVEFPLANNMFFTFFPKSRNQERLISAQPTDRSFVDGLHESGLRISPSELMPSDFERLYLIELNRNKTLEEDQKCLKDVLEKLKSEKQSQKQEYEQFIKQLENEVKFYKGFENRYQDAVTKYQSAEQELTRKTAQIDRFKKEGITHESETIMNELRARLKKLHQEKMDLLDNMVVSRNQITELNNKIYLSKKAQDSYNNFNGAAEVPKQNPSNEVHLENLYIKKISNPETLNKPIEVKGGVLPEGETINEPMRLAKPRKEVNKHSSLPDAELMDSIKKNIDVQQFQLFNKPHVSIDPFNSFENSPKFKDSLGTPNKLPKSDTIIVDRSNPNDVLNNSDYNHEQTIDNPFAPPRNNRAYRNQPNVESDPRTSIDNDMIQRPTNSTNFSQNNPGKSSNYPNYGQETPNGYDRPQYRRPSSQTYPDQSLNYGYGNNNAPYVRTQTSVRAQSPGAKNSAPNVSQNYSYQYYTERPVSSTMQGADNNYPTTSSTRISPVQTNYITRRIVSPTKVIMKEPITLPERQSITSVTHTYPLRTSITRRTISPLPVTTIIHEPQCPNCRRSLADGRLSRSRDGTNSASIKEPIKTTITRTINQPYEPLTRSVTEFPSKIMGNPVAITSYTALPTTNYSNIINPAPERTSIHRIIENNPPRVSYKSGVSIDRPVATSTTRTRVVHSPIHQRTYSPSPDPDLKVSNTKVYKVSYDTIPVSQSDVPLTYSKNQTDFKKQKQPEVITPIRYTSNNYVLSSSARDQLGYTPYQNQSSAFDGLKTRVLPMSNYKPEYYKEYNSLAQSLDMTNNYQSRTYDRVDSYRNFDQFSSIPKRTSLIMDYYPSTVQTLDSNQYRYI